MPHLRLCAQRLHPRLWHTTRPQRPSQDAIRQGDRSRRSAADQRLLAADALQVGLPERVQVRRLWGLFLFYCRGTEIRPECACQSVAVKLCLTKCACQSVAVKVWLSKFGCQSVAVRVWLSKYGCQSVVEFSGLDWRRCRSSFLHHVSR